MGGLISVHDRTNNVRFLINTRLIIAICDYRNNKECGYGWTDIITTTKTFEVAETEQDIIDKWL